MLTAAQPDEHWGVDFARDDGMGGFVRLSRVGERYWYWAYLVGPEVGLVVVRDHEVPRPRRVGVLEVRADSLWAELVCETPGEHWGVSLEAFGVALDSPREAVAVEIGERLAVGLDLEWEVEDRQPFGVVHGDVLLARERIAFEGAGVLRHAVAPETAWPTEWTGSCRFTDRAWRSVGPDEDWQVVAAEERDGYLVPARCGIDDLSAIRMQTLSVVPVPLGTDVGGHESVLVRVLTTVHVGGGMTGTGWLEMLQSRALTGSPGSVGSEEHA